jgi:hypothetical protein
LIFLFFEIENLTNFQNAVNKLKSFYLQEFKWMTKMIV